MPRKKLINQNFLQEKYRRSIHPTWREETIQDKALPRARTEVVPKKHRRRIYREKGREKERRRLETGKLLPVPSDITFPPCPYTIIVIVIRHNVLNVHLR